MNEFISAGGPFMWPLLACSVLIITISIERSWFLQNRLVSPKGLSNQIMNLVSQFTAQIRYEIGGGQQR